MTLYIQFIILLLYILSVYLFDHLRRALAFIAFATGFVFLLNEWDNTVVEDSTLKLVFILSFLLYSIAAGYNIYLITEGED